MPVEDIAKSFNLGLGMGSTFQQYDKIAHERAVNGKMNEILGAVRERGGDITMIDPSMYTDRVGLEAMGRVSQQLANMDEYRERAMRSLVQLAKHRHGVSKGYYDNFDSAVKEGDQPRAMSILSNLVALSGAPYKVVPQDDGTFKTFRISPEGERDLGNVSLLDMRNLIAPYMQNEKRFIHDSVLHGMAMEDENRAYFADSSKHKYVTDARGNNYTLIPSTFERNGQKMYGYSVFGPGGQRNMTMEEVTRTGLLHGQGLQGGAGGVGKDAAKIIDAASTVVDPETGEKRRDPYMAKALTMLTQQMGDPDSAMMALQEWERVLAQDEAVAERLAAMPAGQKAMAIIEIMQQQARPAQKQKPAPQKGDDRVGLHARIRDAAAGKGKPDRIATMPAHQSGSFGLYPWNQ